MELVDLDFILILFRVPHRMEQMFVHCTSTSRLLWLSFHVARKHTETLNRAILQLIRPSVQTTLWCQSQWRQINSLILCLELAICVDRCATWLLWLHMCASVKIILICSQQSKHLIFICLSALVTLTTHWPSQTFVPGSVCSAVSAVTRWVNGCSYQLRSSEEVKLNWWVHAWVCISVHINRK